MPRKPRLYSGRESRRMAELEGVPLASFSARAFAFAIDMVLAALSFTIPAMAGALLAARLGWVRHNVHVVFDPFHHEHWQSVVYFVLFIAASNYIGNGATIGKKIAGIRVVSTVHHRLSLWHSLERALGYGASALEAFFGFFQYFIDPNGRTVHDRIAGTIVVAERRLRARAAQPAAPVPASPVAGTQSPASAP